MGDLGNCGFNLFGGEAEKTYVCFETKGMPWAQRYDIKGDGIIGEDDLKTKREDEYFVQLPSDKKREISCTSAKFLTLIDEAQWKLQELIAWQPALPKGTPALAMIEDIEAKMLAKQKSLSSANPCYGRLIAESRAIIVEMALRARQIVSSDTTDEPFATGMTVSPSKDPEHWWPLRVVKVMPFGAAAAAGILKGDEIVEVNGMSVYGLSIDGTFAGSTDPNTQCTRGFCGPRDSEVTVTFKRGQETFSRTLHRTFWSGRHLGVPF